MTQWKMPSKTKDKLRSGWSVPVRMIHEPTNVKDAGAIGFECKLEDKWEKSGTSSRIFLTRFILQ